MDRGSDESDDRPRRARKAGRAKKDRNLTYRNGTFYVRVQVEGRDVKRSLHTSDRAEAQRRMKPILDDAQRVRAGEAPTYTYGDAVIDWAKSRFGGVKESVQLRYQASLRQLAPHFAPETMLANVKRSDVGRFVQARINAGATHATVRRDLTALSRLFSYAIAMGHLDHNIARDWDRSAIKERRDPIARPLPASIALCVDVAPFPWADLIRLLLANGSRLEETAALRWPDVDLGARQVSFRLTKAGRPRVVTLNDEAVSILAGMPRANRTDFVFWNPLEGTSYRVGAPRGPRLTNLSRRFEDIKAKAALEAVKRGVAFTPFRLHDLRHEYAIRWIEEGRSIYRLQKHLGHSSVKTTEIYLAFVTADVAAKAMGLREEEGQ